MKNIISVTLIFLQLYVDEQREKQAQNLCIDASVDQFWKELKKSKSFVISSIILKCFKNQNQPRICANFVCVNQSQQNSNNCWCSNYAN